MVVHHGIQRMQAKQELNNIELTTRMRLRRKKSYITKSLHPRKKPKTYFNAYHNSPMFLFILISILFHNTKADQILLDQQQSSNTISLHPIILIASIIAAVSVVVLCLALFFAWKKGKERFRLQMEEMHMTKETHREFTTTLPHHLPPALPPYRHNEDESVDDVMVMDQESAIPLPTPSQLDEKSMISLSIVDSKSYLPGDVETQSNASMESYTFSLNSYAPSSIANSSTAYGY